MPALAAEELGWPGEPNRNASDAVLMMRAHCGSPVVLFCSRQYAVAAWHVAACPRRCTRITASHSSALMEKIIRSRRMPALLTSTLRPPYVDTARSTSPVAKSQSPMSPATPIASPPAATISAATFSAPSPMSLTTTFAPAAARARASARPRPAPAPVTTATPPSSSAPPNCGTNGFTMSQPHERDRPCLSKRTSAHSLHDVDHVRDFLTIGAEHQRACRHAGAAGHEYMLGTVDLVDRGASHLPGAFGDAVHSVQICLTELAAVRVDRQPAAELDPAVRDEVLRLARAAEAELLQLSQDERREVVVEHCGRDVAGAQAGGLPDLPCAGAHLRQSDDRLAEERPHHLLVVRHPLRRRLDDDRRLRQVARSFGRRDQDGLTAVGLLAAVEQVQRLHDPARALVVLQRDRLLVEVRGRVGRCMLAVGDSDPAEVR